MPGFVAVVREDIRGLVVDRGHGQVGYAISAALKIALFPRIQAVLWFRVANVFYRRRLTVLAYALQAHILRISGAEIHPAARIGPGFCLVHSNGVVIGDRMCIGRTLFAFMA